MPEAKTEAAAVIARFQRFLEKLAIDPDNARANYRLLGEGFSLPEDVCYQPVRLGGIAGERVSTGQSRTDRALLYLHGGGYVTGDAAAYRHLVSDLARGSATTAWAIDYGLAPEAPFPRGIEDAVCAYSELLENLPARSIVVAGDSAGAGLALGFLLTLRERGLPQPAAVWLVSPLGDLSRTSETTRLKHKLDPLSRDPEKSAAAAVAYLAGAAPDDHRASPVHADMHGLPPLRIDVGSHETLLDDAIAIARRYALADRDVTLQIWAGMIHIFPFFAPILTEGREAIFKAGAFLARHLDKD